MTVEVHAGRSVTLNSSKGAVKGHVIRVNGSSTDETRSIDVGLDGPLPEGAGANLQVDAAIDVGKIDDVLWMARPAGTAPNTEKPLFRIAGDGTTAERVDVKFGRASAQTIEVRNGLKAGDKVIISDTSAWANSGCIHLK